MTTFSYTYEPPKAVLSNLESAQRTYDEVKVAGGYNPTTNTFTPLKLEDKDIMFQEGTRPHVPSWAVFETISAAMEAGIVETEMWPSQLFANQESFREFVSVLGSYEECFKLVDPWWSALRTLAGGENEEEGFCTAADLAERFIEALNDLPEQWQ
ncbi:hypothetical protein LH428_08630 [Laribacter hongkongensis]|uniref:hypothetical protein n=1 Tax=Laribacter hongkongensis TaxID=168471 RepID=UPI001EFC7DCE|nr:hypothetical protein [Laribacter hongkongensis]MCG9115913.1 hypothetical protein [Laribacter hongkongensis]